MPYATLEDVRAIVAEKIPEGLRLEYKSSTILVRRDANTLCKTVSALANSVGGVFIIGIESDDRGPCRIDDGTPGASLRDWIFQTISGGTSPPVEAVDVHDFQASAGFIYAIEVPQSPLAPHQSKDNKYYKRRGSHSEVMEHYEIEDVRNRPKAAIAPLRAELHTETRLAYLKLSNAHETDAIMDVRCEIEANFDLRRDGVTTLSGRGLRSLPPRSKLYFWLGTVPELLQNPEAQITFKFSYAFHGRQNVQIETFHVADLSRTSVPVSAQDRLLEKIGEKLDMIARNLERLNGSVETLNGIVDGTGLRISQRTMRMLRDVPQKFDPQEFDAKGYSIVADISLDDTRSLERIFRYFGGDEASEQYGQIAPETRERFEQHFKLEFD